MHLEIKNYEESNQIISFKSLTLKKPKNRCLCNEENNKKSLEIKL